MITFSITVLSLKAHSYIPSTGIGSLYLETLVWGNVMFFVVSSLMPDIMTPSVSVLESKVNS